MSVSCYFTDHAHTASGDPGFGVIVLVHQQLSTGVAHNQLIQLENTEHIKKQKQNLVGKKIGIMQNVF